MNSLTRILLEDILEIKSQDYIVYFDIDDTLTDYSDRLGNMIITDPETGEKRPIKATDTVNNIEFWTSAKWIPGSKQMFDFAKNNFSNVEILSAVPELSKANKELTGKRFFDAPVDGKTEWLNKNVGPIKTIWTKSGKEKAIYATPNTVLIDDKPENIKAFTQAGGIGILMDTPQNVINKLKDLLEGKNINEEAYNAFINELVTATEIICDNCGWEWDIADGGDDLYICHKCGHDNNPDLAEGRKKKPDPKKGTGKKPEGSSRRLYTDEDPKDTVKVKFKTKEDIVDTLNKKQFKAKSHARQSQVINLIHQRVRAAYGKAKDPEVKARLKRALDYIESRKEASKKKTERLNKMKEASDPEAGTALPYGSGFAPVKENYQFKISDKIYDSEDNSLITVEYIFSTPNNTYRVEFYSGEYSSESKIFDVSFGLDKYGSKIDTFQMTGEGNALSILKTVVDIIKDFTNRFEVNKLVIDPTSEKRGKVYSMVLKYLPQDILNKVELIKENNEKTWNPEELFVSLSKYMIDNGMNIKPLPKIKVISDDKDNASNLLGKTAYYNPTEKSITLYTMDRHPKDILRSFAHEMVHHEQNLNGKLNNIKTTNTNEDGDLPEIEREAYEKGNIMLRNWEDSIKNV